MVRFDGLRARFLEDTAFGGSGATPALTRALEQIGWRAVREPSPEELASHLVLMLEECVHVHRDLSTLELGIAAVLRDTGPMLDGGLPPVEAYLPAAAELVRLYVTDHDRRVAAPASFFAE